MPNSCRVLELRFSVAALSGADSGEIGEGGESDISVMLAVLLLLCRSAFQ